MSIKSDIGRSLIEGRLEHLRDEERRDANALAAVVGDGSPIVLRMRMRADELWACVETIRDEGKQ